MMMTMMMMMSAPLLLVSRRGGGPKGVPVGWHVSVDGPMTKGQLPDQDIPGRLVGNEPRMDRVVITPTRTIGTNAVVAGLTDGEIFNNVACLFPPRWSNQAARDPDDPDDDDRLQR